MAWEENSHICLHMQLIAILSRTGVITSELNLEELAEQADLYDAFCKNGLWNKTLQTYAVMDQDHPFTSVRVREMLKWTESEDYQNLINGGPFCSHCHTPVDPTWKFCQHCGHKL